MSDTPYAPKDVVPVELRFDHASPIDAERVIKQRIAKDELLSAVDRQLKGDLAQVAIAGK